MYSRATAQASGGIAFHVLFAITQLVITDCRICSGGRCEWKIESKRGQNWYLISIEKPQSFPVNYAEWSDDPTRTSRIGQRSMQWQLSMTLLR